ncbi:MAG: tagaturonate epimerase family protein, partial [Candidatus Humimicrobiaceae bacterium]
LDIFKNELKEHANIAKEFGGYKLSLHSGSEKFSTYKAFSEITKGNFHIKTAGTSWLEGLRTIADNSHQLFRNIFCFSKKCFETDRDSYHLTTDTSKLQNIDNVDDDKLADYLDVLEARQVMHVTFGSILTSRDKKGKYLYREELYGELFKNEQLHYRYVSSNIGKHLDLLTN